MANVFDSIADVQVHLPGTVLIYYISWGGQILDKWMWCAELNGEVQDYHRKNNLKQMAEKDGNAWAVLKISRNPLKISIVEKSK